MTRPAASINVSQSFQNLLNTVVNSIPKILVFLIVVVIGWTVAKLLSRIVDTALRKVKFDHFAERGVVGRALSESNTDATRLVARIVYCAILLVTLQTALGVFGPNPISTLLDAVLYAVLLTGGAVVAVGVGGGLIKPMQVRWERVLTAAERHLSYTTGSAYPTDCAHATVSADAGSTDSTGRTGTAAYPQDPASAEGYTSGADPGDWRNPDANYW
jgi:hypothetical protein